MGDRLQTQDRLIEAAREIIINEGMEATSLEHICKATGFTRGAFYSNFSSKDSLLAALAEEEYAGLIERLRATVERWSAPGDEAAPARAGGDRDSEALLMENLLFEALDAIGVERDLFLLHSELILRSIRDPEWAERFSGINEEFVDELGLVLMTILSAAGRELVSSRRALTHSVIGVVLRASAIAGWRLSASRRVGADDRPREPGRSPPRRARSSRSSSRSSTPPHARAVERGGRGAEGSGSPSAPLTP